MANNRFELLTVGKWVVVALLIAAGGYIGYAAEQTAEKKVAVHDTRPQAHYDEQNAKEKALLDHDDKELAHEKMRQAQKKMFDDQTAVLLKAISELER